MIAKYLILGLACLTSSTLAHKSVEEDDDSYLMDREINDFELDKSSIRANYEKQIHNYQLLHKFSDEVAPRTRGQL